MMSPKMKCSYKRNKTAKKLRFRKGHPHLPPKVEKGVDNETDSSDEVPQRIVRPSVDELSDACFAAEFNTPQTVPSKLRPVVKIKCEELGTYSC